MANSAVPKAKIYPTPPGAGHYSSVHRHLFWSPEPDGIVTFDVAGGRDRKTLQANKGKAAPENKASLLQRKPVPANFFLSMMTDFCEFPCHW